MANWDYQIKGVAPLLDEVFDPENPPTGERFLELRDGVFKVLAAHPLYDEDCECGTDAQRWTDAVSEIKYTSDPADLEEMLHGVYDEADTIRIWISPID
jgi:hypothetical protein